MKICLTAVSNTLDSQLDSRFGRSQWFIIVNPETMEFESVSNSALQSMHGAGLHAARQIADKEVNVVISGNVGPNAFSALSSEGIAVVTGVSGPVKDIVERYKRGELSHSDSPTVSGHRGRGNRWRQ